MGLAAAVAQLPHRALIPADFLDLSDVALFVVLPDTLKLPELGKRHVDATKKGASVPRLQSQHGHAACAISGGSPSPGK